jgi:site-specific DNA recombinase
MGGPDHQGCGRLTVAADPLEDLVQASVLYRLDTPQLADALAGRNSLDEETAGLSDALAKDRDQLDELATMYAAREIGRNEWVTARQSIDARVKDLERHLSRITRNDALSGIVGNGVALGAQWADLNLSRQHAIVRAVLDHAVISPTERRGAGLDPGRVDLVWRI